MMPNFAGVMAFVHVAEQRSFRSAARILGITPTAVSKAVSRLEEQLKTRLLHRTSRHVALTSEGEIYLRHCREALDRLQAGEDELTRAMQIASGPLAVSVPFVLGQLVVSNLGRLLGPHPQLAIALSLTDRDVSLAEEEIDVVVRIGTLPDSSLVGRRLRTPRWVTVASPGYLARAPALGDWRDLAEHTTLRFLRPAGGIGEWRFLPESGAEPVVFRSDSAILLDQGELLVSAALAGLGIAQVFDFMVEEHIHRGDLTEVLRHQAAMGPPIHALTLPGRSQVPKIRAFIDFIEEILGRSDGITADRADPSRSRAPRRG